MNATIPNFLAFSLIPLIAVGAYTERKTQEHF